MMSRFVVSVFMILSLAGCVSSDKPPAGIAPPLPPKVVVSKIRKRATPTAQAGIWLSLEADPTSGSGLLVGGGPFLTISPSQPTSWVLVKVKSLKTSKSLQRLRYFTQAELDSLNQRLLTGGTALTDELHFYFDSEFMEAETDVQVTWSMPWVPENATSSLSIGGTMRIFSF